MPDKTRYLYIVEKRGEDWVVTHRKAVCANWGSGTAVEAMRYAADLLNGFWHLLGQRSELRLRKKDGTLSDPRTYGKDPRKTKG